MVVGVNSTMANSTAASILRISFEMHARGGVEMCKRDLCYSSISVANWQR